ncbi:uncharacterized protein Dvar_51770 [Desulfosarcina variabilis str. Montpellier]
MHRTSFQHRSIRSKKKTAFWWLGRFWFLIVEQECGRLHLSRKMFNGSSLKTFKTVFIGFKSL